MNIRNRQDLRARRTDALSHAAYHPGKLALIHTAIAVGVTLVLTVVNLLLNEWIDETGGLNGIGLRTMLTTIKSTLSILSAILLPFWDMGFLYAVLKLSRKEKTGPSDLLQGFRRFGPVLRLKLLEILIYAILTTIASNIGIAIFMMTPFATPLADVMATLDPLAPDTEVIMAAMAEIALPLYGILGVITALIILPVSYRFRMARYLIVDDPVMGAMVALGTSNGLMRNNRAALLRLDLSFWWYYGLQFVCAFLAYSDVLAAALGITLPFSPTAALLIACILYCLAKLVMAWFFDCPVETTYAVAFETLRQMRKDAEPRIARNFPWDFLPEYKEPENEK